MFIDTFSKHFDSIEDPRQTAKISHPFFDIMFVTMCAVIAGADGWKEIQEYAEGHLDWFQDNGILLAGAPVDDTIARIISRIKPEQFRQSFINWMQSINELSKGDLIAIDGKVLRGSYDRDDKRSTIHMVSAFATANKVVIGQLKTNAKSNEITAIPELLRLLDIKGCLISIDAIACQTKIAKEIIDNDADYLLAVKGNQNSLYSSVKDALAAELTKKLDPENLSIEQGHGRLEARSYHVISAQCVADKHSEWQGLTSIGVAVGYRQIKGKPPSLDYRYYISSADLTVKRFSEAVRGHWLIENSLHWVLDTAMNEDACQIYRDNGAENLACMRHFALNMLRTEPTKLSIKLKQKRAWMKTSFLESVLVAGFNNLDDIQ
jgi:predicted transposase YbfD/YdcC